MLAKWREESTAGPWRVDVFGHGGAFVQIVQPAEFQPGYDPNRFDNMDIDIANVEQTAADACLIVGTAGNSELLDAVVKMLDNAQWHIDHYGSVEHPWAGMFAAAIIAADERMRS